MARQYFCVVETTQKRELYGYFLQKVYPETPAHLAFVWFFSCVYQVVFLQVGELSKTLVAGLAFERPFSTVHSQVNLEEATGVSSGPETRPAPYASAPRARCVPCRCKHLRKGIEMNPAFSLIRRPHPWSPSPSRVSYGSSALNNPWSGSRGQTGVCLGAETLQVSRGLPSGWRADQTSWHRHCIHT